MTLAAVRPSPTPRGHSASPIRLPPISIRRMVHEISITAQKASENRFCSYVTSTVVFDRKLFLSDAHHLDSPHLTVLRGSDITILVNPGDAGRLSLHQRLSPSCTTQHFHCIDAGDVVVAFTRRRRRIISGTITIGVSLTKRLLNHSNGS